MGYFRGGRTAGRTKWTDKIYELDGQNRVLEGCDREGLKYRFFCDNPEKHADRYPLKATVF